MAVSGGLDNLPPKLGADAAGMVFPKQSVASGCGPQKMQASTTETKVRSRSH